MAKKYSILTIDGDPQIQHALQEIVQSRGWEALSAGDLEEGVQMLCKYRPDLVLMDSRLPKINGGKGVELLRQEDPNVPLIVSLSMDDDQEVADALLDAGANDFILKPFRRLDIISRVRMHIRLLESQRCSQAAGLAQVKGIGQSTLALLEDCLRQAEDYLPVESIAERTGLAYQTTYRYLQHMVAWGRVKVIMSYGKVGRPKQRYRLDEPKQE